LGAPVVGVAAIVVGVVVVVVGVEAFFADVGICVVVVVACIACAEVVDGVVSGVKFRIKSIKLFLALILVI
jgi:hypothetical protein